MKFSYSIVVECDLRMYTDGEFHQAGRGSSGAGLAFYACTCLTEIPFPSGTS
jgi:hypothetical protein